MTKSYILGILTNIKPFFYKFWNNYLIWIHISFIFWGLFFMYDLNVDVKASLMKR